MRKEIDQYDKSLVEIIEKRLEIVLDVLKYKQEKGLPILHPQREHEVIEKTASYLRNPKFSKEIEDLFKEIMRLSRKRQSKILFPHNIVLIGFMGSGKSTVGKLLAQQLEMEYVDMDHYIQEKLGMTVEQIFEEYGEEFFRQHEKEATKELGLLNHTIIVCGGGVVLNPENITNLKRNGKTILLDTEAEEIYNRIKDDKSRPLLKDKMSIAYIDKLLHQRKSLYADAADIVVDTHDKNIDNICKEIVGMLLNS
jgi:shikimate kinase